MIDKAIKLAAQVHEGQVDKGGEPYILHALAVMELCRKNYRGINNKDDLLVAAILHDTREDNVPEKTGITGPELVHYIYDEFGESVGDAVELLTKPKWLPYSDYIDQISISWLATEVKIADLTHNMDVTRLPSHDIDRVDYERWDKYRKALVKLK